MSKKKKGSQPTNHIKTIRVGAVGAQIRRGATPDGFTFLYFVPVRYWQPMASERERPSERFYDRNRDDLKAAIDLAADWITANPNAADGAVAESTYQPRSTDGLPAAA